MFFWDRPEKISWNFLREIRPIKAAFILTLLETSFLLSCVIFHFWASSKKKECFQRKSTRHCGNRTRKIMQMRKNESTRIFRAQMQLSRSLRCHSQSSSATFLSLAFGFWHKGKNVLTLFHTSMTKMFQFYTHAKATSLQDHKFLI